VCSGIEAASVAWEPLGFKPVFFSEVDAFPSAVLAHHWPHVPNHGDMTKFEEWGYGPGSIDVLAGGPPCQSFSIAGKRLGLADDRGNLSLVYARILERLRPKFFVWENVPGVLSSNSGRDFASILGAFQELGYGWAYRVLDAQYFGVPQRRRRVFVVGCAGDWRGAAAVLFEPESLRGNSQASGKAREETAVGARDRAETSGICDPIGTLCSDTHPGAYSGQDAYTGRLVPDVGGGGGLSPHSRCLEAILPSWWDGGQIAQTLDAVLAKGQAMPERNRFPAILTPTPTGGFFDEAPRIGVRRLTPIETERLQGFPDAHTLVEYRGKTAADGPRYKAIGNSMAVPVMAWIGKRIKEVNDRMRYT
jgi:DNA (cytosine-5)-methyltransferase 1